MLLIASGTRGLAPMRALLNWTPVQVSSHRSGMRRHHCMHASPCGESFSLLNSECHLTFDICLF